MKIVLTEDQENYLINGGVIVKDGKYIPGKIYSLKNINVKCTGFWGYNAMSWSSSFQLSNNFQ